jgi:hypothetical protein
MRWKLIVLMFLVTGYHARSQHSENLIIITLDGMRWQEVFGGMDSVIANDKNFNQDDSQYIFSEYWHSDPVERRKKLMPFLWNTIAAQGQVAGNRTKGNLVNVSNPYWFSFPGYNEIFTGYPDTSIDRNDHPANHNVTVLEFFNRQPAFKGKVAAFGAWNAFDRIFNEQRAGFPVFSAFDTVGGKNPNGNEKLLNRMLRDSYKPWLEGECLDVFTHYAAMEWLKTRRPKVLYIAYGETDEWAHSGMYRSYLDAARQTDQWISEIWKWIKQDPRYGNRTTLFITTDHGRGDAVKKEWTSHNSKVRGADQIWFAALGPAVPALGEVASKGQVYQQQFAQTFARLLGMTYQAGHPIGPPLKGFGK